MLRPGERAWSRRACGGSIAEIDKKVQEVLDKPRAE
jgi:hypothetical protein